jgi:hypothetical protein
VNDVRAIDLAQLTAVQFVVIEQRAVLVALETLLDRVVKCFVRAKEHNLTPVCREHRPKRARRVHVHSFRRPPPRNRARDCKPWLYL